MNTLDNLAPGSLRYEIANAANGDMIAFDSSLNGQAITLAGAELTISKNLTIQGPGSGLLTINGGGYNGSRVFEIDGAATSVTLTGLTITGGGGVLDYPYIPSGGGIGWSGGGHTSGGSTSGGVTVYDGEGGAVWNGGVLQVSDCTFTNNFASQAFDGSDYFAGGAIYNAGTLTVSNSTLTGNAASNDGGAIYNAGTLTVSNSTLTDNYAYGDGGAICNAGTLTVSNSTLTGNCANGYGGAIYNAFSSYGMTASLTDVTVSNNTAFYGGGLWNSGAMTLTTCTVTANTATVAGGGIYNAKGGRLTIQSASRVTGNTATAGLGADLDTPGAVKISKDSTVGVTGR
jgi:hypothetical protein